MRISYDEDKRYAILKGRAIDIANARLVFEEFHLTRKDLIHSIDEERFISVGMFRSDVVIVVWTDRTDSRRIITMWKANDKERQAYFQQRDRSG